MICLIVMLTDTRSRKIVPCVYKKCELPPSVRYSFCIDYNRSGKLWNFWDKLSQSLAAATSANSQTNKARMNAPPEHKGNHDVAATISKGSYCPENITIPL